VKKSTASSEHRTRWTDLLRHFLQVLTVTIDTIGWPGTVLLLLFFILEYNGTAEQKHQFIDMYILGKGMSPQSLFVIPCILFLVIIAAQNFYWRKRIRILERENQRLSEWKSGHQQANIATNLQHTKTSGRRS
jgi:hypothetical protein